MLAVSRQCELLGIARSTVYYHPVAPPPLDEVLKRRLDELYTAHPFYGSRRMTAGDHLSFSRGYSLKEPLR